MNWLLNLQMLYKMRCLAVL